jgi:hypothetical protein
VKGLRTSCVTSLALALAAFSAARAANAEAISAAAPVSQPAAATGHATLERRVEALSKALDLDAHQRAQLLGILQAQRAAVSEVWRDPALLPAERGPATRAIEQHTAEQIRAILSDKQKERYNPPKPQSTFAPSPDVDKWLELTRNSQAGESK